MTVGLLSNLIDRIIQLVRYRQERRKCEFVNFIEPIWIDFQKVHEQYLISFKEYRSIIKDVKSSYEFIIDKIKEDILFNEGCRKKIYALSGLNEIEDYEKIDDSTQRFIYCVYKYLTNQDDFIHFPDGHKEIYRYGCQRFRTSFLRELEFYCHWRSKDQVEKDIREMNEKEQRNTLFRYYRHKHYQSSIPEYLIQLIGESNFYMALKKKIDSIDKSLIEKSLIEIEYNSAPSLENNKKEAIYLLDTIVGQMQEMYSDTATAYTKLKRDLLRM